MPREKKEQLLVYKESVKLSQEITGVMENSALPGIRKLGGHEFRMLLKKRLSSINIKLGRKPEEKKKIKRKVNETGLKGCYKKSGKFYVQVSVNSKKHYLGNFSSIELARKARIKFIKENNLKIAV